MTHPNDPPTQNDISLKYSASADEHPIVLNEDEKDDEVEDDESSSGGGDSKGLGKYKVILDPLVDYTDEEGLSEEENTISKLRKLGLAPMSYLVNGGSSFASENDLSRKIFMANVAMVTQEINSRDISNPKLFHVLDVKQAERRALFGIKTLDEIVTGAVGAVGAAIQFVSSSVSDFVKEKKEERKASRLIKNFEEGTETYSLDSADDYVSRDSLETADFPVQDFQGDDLASFERDRLYDDLSRDVQRKLDSGDISFAEAFNTLGDAKLLSERPVRTLRLSDDIQIGSDGPGSDKELNPMGG